MYLITHCMLVKHLKSPLFPSFRAPKTPPKQFRSMVASKDRFITFVSILIKSRGHVLVVRKFMRTSADRKRMVHFDRKETGIAQTQVMTSMLFREVLQLTRLFQKVLNRTHPVTLVQFLEKKIYFFFMSSCCKVDSKIYQIIFF